MAYPTVLSCIASLYSPSSLVWAQSHGKGWCFDNVFVFFFLASIGGGSWRQAAAFWLLDLIDFGMYLVGNFEAAGTEVRGLFVEVGGGDSALG